MKIWCSYNDGGDDPHVNAPDISIFCHHSTLFIQMM